MTVKREYYDSGQLRYEVPYQKGKLHGIEKRWYENGQLWLKTPWHQGKEHGAEQKWYEDGELRYERYYIYGTK